MQIHFGFSYSGKNLRRNVHSSWSPAFLRISFTSNEFILIVSSKVAETALLSNAMFFNATGNKNYRCYFNLHAFKLLIKKEKLAHVKMHFHFLILGNLRNQDNYELYSLGHAVA